MPAAAMKTKPAKRGIFSDLVAMGQKPKRPKEAKCVQCGCTDSRACENGCWWLSVDYGKGTGLCSECPV